MSNGLDCDIRTATSADIGLIYTFIQQKAAFDRDIGAFCGELLTSEAKIHQTLFGSCPFAYVLLAMHGSEAFGFALYGFRYSSFAGQPSLWLDDLFVNGPVRSQGIGKRLMQSLVKIAHPHHCTHLGWTADDRNQRGLLFYRRLGAEVIAQQGHRCFLSWKPLSVDGSFASSLTSV